MNAFRDAALVAWFDVFESIRSRKFMALLVLHLLGAVVMTAGFIEVLQEIETTLADTLAVAATDKPGTMTTTLMESEEFLEIVGHLLKDEELAAELVSLPPIALFYSWLIFFALPVLVVITSSDAISQELASGSARYAMFRTSRMAWAVGKLGGQSMLMAIMVFAGAIGVWVVAYFMLGSFDGPGTALWLFRFGLRAVVYGFAFLGLALGVSQLTSSVNGSRALGLLALIGFGVGGRMLMWDRIVEYVPGWVTTIAPLFPNTHKVDLWRPDLFDRGPAMIMLFGLGIAFFVAGHWRLSRRDV
ncbi:MAG: ABC transporter permease subunit [Proteobacteria bacterium]|nr:ABC transporter permease subunit [Pseudomonadota bacterium]MCP4919389.1 ABC transporter permease subunit [Pseudomonadota bacterium]